MLKTKVCSKCGRKLSFNNFGKQIGGKNGLKSQCKDCIRLYRIKYVLENREYIRWKEKQYHTINKELVKQRREKIIHILRYKKRQYKENNKEKVREYNKKYAEEHRDKSCASSQRRRSRERQLPATFTLDQWEQCKQHFDNKCAYCGEEKPLQQDHFIALSKGGGYTSDNIIPSCKSCNSSKKDEIFEEWYINKKYYNEYRELKILEYISIIKLRS